MKLEALDKSKYLSKAFFNEKACSLTIRKADKVLIYRTITMIQYVYIAGLIGVININEKVLVSLVKHEQFSEFNIYIKF
ncbi:MAG: hypothetical protein GY775_04580 [Candidatus Scalindua sp.]|nr:hypothetical protein [Candidatus Scalindua sp.]